MNRFFFRGFMAMFFLLSTWQLQALDATNIPTITVFAASSATDCLTLLGQRYEKLSKTHVRLNFASSSILARQIGQGAGCDIFLSADQEWMDYLEKRNLIQPQTRRNLLRNKLVVVTPRQHPLTVRMDRSFDFPAAFSGRLAVGDPAHVPAGKYAREALEKMGWWDKLESRLAPAENVRAALMLVERGETDAGIVYLTDVATTTNVSLVATFPEDTHTPICYPIALCAGANPAAATFIDFLSAADAVPVWTNAGFTVLQPQ